MRYFFILFYKIYNNYKKMLLWRGILIAAKKFRPKNVDKVAPPKINKRLFILQVHNVSNN